MNWVNVIWSSSAGFCFSLALVFLLNWLHKRDSWVSISFSLFTISIGFVLLFEQAFMHAGSPEIYGELLKWEQIPNFLVVVGYLWFVRSYLRAGRLWLLWIILGFSVIRLAVNFMVEPNITFEEITAITQIPFLGENVSIPVGVPSRWETLGVPIFFLIPVFIVDGAVTSWRRGERREAMVMVAAMALTSFGSLTLSLIIAYGLMAIPLTVHMPSFAAILVMSYELSRDLFRARQTAERLRLSREALQESEVLIRTLMVATSDIGQVLDEDGIVLNANRSFLERMGTTGREIIGTCIYDRFPEEETRLRKKWIRTALEEGKPVRFEDYVSRTESYFESSIYPLNTPEGEKRRVLLMAQDITERKKAEKALLESEQLARSLLNATTDLTHLLDEDGIILDLNEAMAERLGGTREELIGTSVFDRLPGAIAGARREVLERVRVERKAIRYVDRQRPDFILDVGIYPIKTAEGEKDRFVVFAHDITQREQTLQALQESEARLKEAQRLAHIGNWDLDLRNDRLVWSDEIFQIFEIGKEEFGASYEAFLNAIHPEDREIVNNAYAESLENRTPYQITHRLIMKDGRIKFVEEQCNTFFDSEGKPLRSVGTVQDITDRRQSEDERRELLHELARYNRFAQMSELTASISHEINQPLGAILNNTTVAKRLAARLEGGEAEFMEILEDIAADASRAAKTIRNVRNTFGKGIDTHEVLNLNSIVVDVVDMFQKQLSNNEIKSNLDLQATPAFVEGNRIALQQVLTNLITNAIDSMQECHRRMLSVTTTRQFPNSVTVRISDSGKGIGAEEKDRVFEPFYTSKTDGIGIGLRICQSIIQEHGGRIWFENNLKEGTSFFFSLPASSEGSL